MSYATTIDLVSLIQQKSGIDLVRRASTGSGEYWGFCPFCKAGEKRFHVWPNDTTPHWWCRRCGKRGTAPWFLVEYCNMNFFDACQELGIELEDREEYTSPSFSEMIARDDPPSAKWQDAARIFVERAEVYLWHPRSPEGQQALAYLRGRGLTDETIRRARLGYCPAMKNGDWYSDSFEHWGIDLAAITDEKKRERGKVVIPPGIVIPWFEGDRIWKIAVKRLGQPKGKDYGQVLGSKEGMYNISSVQFDQPAMIVESELCALSVMQEAGDIINVVATGSVSRGRRARWIADLSLASCVLQSFDDDVAGDDNAPYWIQALERCIRWSPMYEKDPNDILAQLGAESLRNWVRWGMYAWENAQALDNALVPPAREAEPVKAIPIEQESSEDEALYAYASMVSQIVDIFGGPSKVTVQKHESGLTLAEYLRRTGQRSHPVSLKQKAETLPARSWGR